MTCILHVPTAGSTLQVTTAVPGAVNRCKALYLSQLGLDSNSHVYLAMHTMSRQNTASGLKYGRLAVNGVDRMVLCQHL